MFQTPHHSSFAAVPAKIFCDAKTSSDARRGKPETFSVILALSGLVLLALAAFLSRRTDVWQGSSDILFILLLTLAASSILFIALRNVFLSSKTKALAVTETRLEESEKRFKDLFENMNSCAAIYEATPDGQDFVFKAVNKALEKTEQLDRQNVIGRSVCDIFQGVREYGLYDLLNRVRQTGYPEFIQARYYRRDRRQGWKENSAYQLPTGEVVVIYQDVSRRKRAEEALRRSEETFTKIFQSSPAAMMISHSKSGQILDINKAFEKLTGYQREKLIGQSIYHPMLGATPEDHLALQEMLAEPAATDREIKLMTPEGKKLVTLYSTQKIQLATDSCLLSMVVDLSFVRQAEDERHLLEKQLYESQKMEAVGTLAGGIAHDFNNILGAIIGYAEMAGLQAKSGLLSSYLDQILTAGLRARDLVAQILTFSRRQEHDKKPLDLKIIVKETLKLLRSTLPSSIDIRSNLESSAGTIVGDPTQMHQVIMNLCTNAAHAMGEAGGTLTVIIAREDIPPGQAASLGLQPGRHLRLVISDTGCGIAPENLNRIFDPFFTTKKAGEGTGLGLSVVYGIVKNHEGAIRVTSWPGQGTSFNIFLPFLHTIDPVAQVSSGLESLPGGQEHILFVDDEKPLVDLALHHLTALGYQVTACRDGQQALNLFQSDPGRFDLVITDMTMPRLSGSELARRIVGLKPDQPIILCTGYSEFITPEKAAAIGIRTFALKPLSRKDLAFIIRKTLDRPVSDNTPPVSR